MAIDYQQENTAMVCTPAAFCSGASMNTATDPRQAVEGGSAGGLGVNLTIDQASLIACFFYEVLADVADTWAAGNWTVRVNLTGGNADVTLEEVHICRVNSSCVNQETLGSNTGLGLSTTGGQQNVVVNQPSAASPSAGDKIIIVLVFTNAATMGNQKTQLTHDQLITSPYVAAGAGGAPHYYQHLIGQGA